MNISKVIDCSAVNCIYNVNKQCRTPAITVGSPEATCDTFLNGQQKAGEMDVTGGVGACRKADCIYNESLECRASGIHVMFHKGHADCSTFNAGK